MSLGITANLGEDLFARKEMQPETDDGTFRVPKASSSQYCSDGLSTKALLTDSEKWSHSASLRQFQSGHQEWGNKFLIVLTYFITTAAQSAAWASPSFQLLCQTGFEDWSVSDPTLITAASITPQLFFHLSLLMHWCWFSGSKESKVLLITHNGITLIMLMPGACFFPRTHCLLHWQ